MEKPLADLCIQGVDFILLFCEICHLMVAGMQKVGWSCLTLTAFPSRPFNLASVLIIFGVKWHQCVAILPQLDEDIVFVTQLRQAIVAFFFHGWLTSCSFLIGNMTSETHHIIYQNDPRDSRNCSIFRKISLQTTCKKL